MSALPLTTPLLALARRPGDPAAATVRVLAWVPTSPEPRTELTPPRVARRGWRAVGPRQLRPADRRRCRWRARGSGSLALCGSSGPAALWAGACLPPCRLPIAHDLHQGVPRPRSRSGSAGPSAPAAPARVECDVHSGACTVRAGCLHRLSPAAPRRPVAFATRAVLPYGTTGEVGPVAYSTAAGGQAPNPSRRSRRLYTAHLHRSTAPELSVGRRCPLLPPPLGACPASPTFLAATGRSTVQYPRVGPPGRVP